MLRQAGHDVVSVVEQGMQGSTDFDLIEVCRRENRGLVTLDLEFGNPLVFTPSDYPGIAVLRLPHGGNSDDLRDAVRTLAIGLEREAFEGKLWIIQRGRIRQYQEDC